MTVFDDYELEGDGEDHHTRDADWEAEDDDHR